MIRARARAKKEIDLKRAIRIASKYSIFLLVKLEYIESERRYMKSKSEQLNAIKRSLETRSEAILISRDRLSNLAYNVKLISFESLDQLFELLIEMRDRELIEQATIKQISSIREDNNYHVRK